MSVNGISASVGASYTNQTTRATKTEQQTVQDDTACVYEKSSSDSAKKTYTVDQETVARLKADLNYRQNQMQGLVDKLLGTQSGKANSVLDLIKGLKSGTLSVDADTIAKAKSEIAEDGYWGVNQTSDRLVEMAKALSGGDPDKADKMIGAIKKGFDQATKSFGGQLPQLCQDTVDSAVQKLTDWKNSITE